MWAGEDKCAGDTPAYTEAQCANTGVAAGQYGTIAASPADQYNLKGGGNENLGAEAADTITFGVVVNPMDDLSFSIDYWDIEIEDTIRAPGSQLSLDACAETGEALFLWMGKNRSPSGSLWTGTAGWMTASLANLGETHFEGIDFEGDYAMTLGEGSLSINALATYMLTKESTPFPLFLRPSTIVWV